MVKSHRSELTYGLGQSDDHFLAGGYLGDPAYDPLDPVHPNLELHSGSGDSGQVTQVRCSEGACCGGLAPSFLEAPAGHHLTEEGEHGAKQEGPGQKALLR